MDQAMGTTALVTGKEAWGKDETEPKRNKVDIRKPTPTPGRAKTRVEIVDKGRGRIKKGTYETEMGRFRFPLWVRVS